MHICIANKFKFFFVLVTDKTDSSEESNKNPNEEMKKNSISDQFVFDF